jgi:hypothetical protein
MVLGFSQLQYPIKHDRTCTSITQIIKNELCYKWMFSNFLGHDEVIMSNFLVIHIQLCNMGSSLHIGCQGCTRLKNKVIKEDKNFL